jgi:hypothetical protein
VFSVRYELSLYVLHSAHRMYLCVPYGSRNEYQLSDVDNALIKRLDSCLFEFCPNVSGCFCDDESIFCKEK